MRSGTADSAEALLTANGLSVRFGGLAALTEVTFDIEPGEIVGVIGPNGAGKTTLFNTITGVCTPQSGEVVFDGERITRMAPHAIAARGLRRTFQHADVFEDLSVADNCRVAHHTLAKPGLARALLGGPRLRRAVGRMERRVGDVLSAVGLEDSRDTLCRELGHGQRKLVSFAIGLVTEPRLLLLDEPLAGLSDSEVTSTLDLCERARSRGTAILLVEHNVGAVMKLCDRIVVLSFGRKIADGTPQTVQASDVVVEAYLGRKLARQDVEVPGPEHPPTKHADGWSDL